VCCSVLQCAAVWCNVLQCEICETFECQEQSYTEQDGCMLQCVAVFVSA